MASRGRRPSQTRPLWRDPARPRPVAAEVAHQFLDGGDPVDQAQRQRLLAQHIAAIEQCIVLRLQPPAAPAAHPVLEPIMQLFHQVLDERDVLGLFRAERVQPGLVGPGV